MAAWLVVCPFALASSIAWADPPPDPSKAEALFRWAKDRMSKGDYPAACAALAESENLDPQVGTALNLAYCQEHLGRTATAWSIWLRAAAGAAAKGERQRQEFAESRANLLERQLFRVTIVVTAQSVRERLRLVVDDAPIPPAEWGSPIPVDPGDHELVAVAEGYRPWRRKVTVAKGFDPTLVVPELEPLAVPARARSTGGRSSGWPAVAWATGAAGVAALGVGGGFGIAALVNENASNANRNCVPNGCGPEGMADRSRAKSDEHVANVMFATGGAAILASAVVYFVFRVGRGPPSGSWTAGVSPTAGGGAAVFGVRRW